MDVVVAFVDDLAIGERYANDVELSDLAVFYQLRETHEYRLPLIDDWKKAVRVVEIAHEIRPWELDGAWAVIRKDASAQPCESLGPRSSAHHVGVPAKMPLMSGKLERCLSAFAEEGARHRKYLDINVGSPSCLKLVHQRESAIVRAVVDADNLIHRADQAFQAERD